MRHAVYGLLLAASLATPPSADEPRNSGIEATINGQIAAFLADDFSRAFTFASPGVRDIFRNAENFGTMVKRGYPMVWRPADVKMLELRRVAGGLWQRVMVRDQGGRIHMLDYQMVETPEGWQINAVQLLPHTGVGA
ncbi:DUF4864 domain-containing protein [Paracoccaceae bacterium Fryx2]|nr:DUF4864 domain-containing protein [Paracoccaceae bacterium Fryx2]